MIGGGIIIKGDLVEIGVVVEIIEVDEVYFLKSGEIVVNGDEIVGGVGEVVMELFDVGGCGVF